MTNRLKIWLGVVFGFSIFTNLLMLTGPLFMLQVYDRVLSSKSIETLVALVVLVGGLYGAYAMIDFARSRLLARAGARLQQDLCQQVFKSDMAVRRSGDNQQAQKGNLRDLDFVGASFSSGLVALFDIPWSPVFFAAIFLFHPLLGWLAVFGAAVLVALTLVNGLLTRRRNLASVQASQQAQLLADEVSGNADTIRGMAMGNTMSLRWRMFQDQAILLRMSAADRGGAFTSFTKSFRLFLQSAMLGLGAYLAIHELLTPGAMIAGTILLGRALAPIEQTMGQWETLQKATASWKRLSALEDLQSVKQEQFQLSRPSAEVQLDNLTVIPPGGSKPTLLALSFKIIPGEAIGIIGKSGSGNVARH